LLDSNVFIAAIKDPSKQTDTLNLIMKIIADPNVTLVANELLIDEMIRYAELLESETAAALVAALLGRTSPVRVSENYRKICMTYIHTPDRADVLHAATCLQTESILITNDHHFDRMRDQGIIKVWSIRKAIQELLGSRG
jgi:predicted nucleic acid-binding protein